MGWIFGSGILVVNVEQPLLSSGVQINRSRLSVLTETFMVHAYPLSYFLNVLVQGRRADQEPNNLAESLHVAW